MLTPPTKEELVKDIELARDYVLQGYEIENNIITSPGKFEGEYIATPYFYECYMDGDGEDNINSIDFEISEAEKTVFPVLCSSETFSLVISDNGFVHGIIN